MVLTREIAPHHELKKFVRCYTFRQFNTQGETLTRPWYAIHQISMPFFFKAVPVKLTDPVTGKELKTGKSTGIVGLAGKFNGNMTFNGNYSFFEILFTPTGFSHIFQIPGKEIMDQIFWGEEVFSRDHAILHEKMLHATSLAEIKNLADQWLLSKISRGARTQALDRVTWAANSILKQHGLICPSKLAYEVNMSIRTFERRFINEVGLSPKHLCCITRFNNAFEMKLSEPRLDWTAIAQYAGYYDQMHLIKDFKRFSGEAPKSLLNFSEIMQVEYSERISD